mgnify:CR=1 FL=1
MRYKYLYIIFFSIMFSQSFFNRILPGEVYEGDAKSMAIGNSSLTTSYGSGVIISNPAKILSINESYMIDLNINFNSLSERRSIVFKDEWEESLGETEVSTDVIGEIVMEGLQSIDSVAYVRFASVYKNFKEAKDFEQFVGNLDDNKS